MAGIPVQSIRVSTLGQANWSLQYSLQSFSVALYAKMNGIPWTVDQDLTISDEPDCLTQVGESIENR